MKANTSKKVVRNWLAAGIAWRYRVLVNRLQAIARVLRGRSHASPYILEGGRYDAAKYWADRHNRFRHSFRGVGNASRSEEENIRDYTLAVDAIADLLRSVSCDPRGKTMLDIGCGNGFWTGIFRAWGVATYTGIDITDALFEQLRNRYPALEFISGDFQQLPLRGGFQIITMIDVSQHVTSDTQLQGMLGRVRSLLADDGVFIVTFWNQARPQENFYEAFRLFGFYTAALDGMAHTEPMQFRDKFIAAFYSPQRRPDDVSAPPLPREAIAGIVERVLGV